MSENQKEEAKKALSILPTLLKKSSGSLKGSKSRIYHQLKTENPEEQEKYDKL